MSNSEFEPQTQLLEMEETRDVVSLRKCQLRVIAGPDEKKKFDLNRKITRIGKKEDNDIALLDNTVSRLRVEIEITADSYLLKDMNSTNGTFVNGMRIKQQVLKANDKIQISSATVLRFSYVDTIDKNSLERFDERRSTIR